MLLYLSRFIFDEVLMLLLKRPKLPNGKVSKVVMVSNLLPGVTPMLGVNRWLIELFSVESKLYEMLLFANLKAFILFRLPFYKLAVLGIIY